MKSKSYVYLLKMSGEDIYKIGVSKNVDKRVKQLQIGNSDEIEIVDKFLSNYPYKLEAFFHRKYNYEKVRGEWFYLSTENVEKFKNDCELYENNFKFLEESGNPFFK